MRLLKLRMFNFRQFYGNSEIVFSTNSDPKGNVIVIFGENGRGKTGIFRAIMYCLFNERKLSQDGDISEKEIQLINNLALEENEDSYTDAFVELEFVHKGNVYVLKRSMVGSKKNNAVEFEATGASLSKKLPSGNTIKIDTSEIDKEIHNILDKRVKDYFLFDGERIERLTRASVEQRKEISVGIRRLLNVDSLEKAKLALTILTKELEQECAAIFSPEYAKLIREINKNEQQQLENTERMDGIEKEILLANAEKDKLDRELDSIKEIRNHLEKRKEIESTLAAKEQNAKELLLKIKDYPRKIASGIIVNLIEDVLKHIEGLKSKGQLPSEIRKDLIERILSERTCICGNEVEEGNEAYTRIIEWLNKTNDQDVQDSILDLWRLLSEILSNCSSDYDATESILVQYSQEKNDLEKLRNDLEDIRKMIGSSDRIDAFELDDCRKKIEQKLINLEADRKNAENEAGILLSDYLSFQLKIEQEKKKQNMKSEIERRAVLARETKNALIETHAKFTNEIKEVIGKYASEAFNMLLDDDGKEMLKSVVVSEDYSLQVLDKWNRPFLANISAGQRQIMSIAFIIALAKAAANDGLLEIPLFMDTPFGRLSYVHRKNLINLLPRMASQWVLLATDTEFRQKEAKELKATGAWAKMYLLKQTVQGNTKIEKIDIDNAIALLKDRE